MIRKTLHEITFGSQDEYIEKTNWKPLEYDFIETCTVNDNKPVIRFNHLYESPELKGKGITNLKIEGDWESLEVVIGGQLVDKIYKIWECNSPYILQAPYYIPFLEHHSIDICVSHNKQYTLTYDIVSVSHSCALLEKNKDKDKEYANTGYEFVFKTLNFTGFQDIESDIQYTYIPFNHPIERLVVYCDNPVDYIKFLYNKKTNLSLTLSFQKINDKKWELDFGEQTVNFSRIERPYIEICSSTKNTIGVFAVAKKVGTIKNGRFGLKFSK